MKHEPLVTGTKVCRTCKRELPVLAFSVNPTSKDGLKPDCRGCVSLYMHRHSVKTGRIKGAFPGKSNAFDWADDLPAGTEKVLRKLAFREPKKRLKVSREVKSQHCSEAAKDAWKRVTPEQKAARIAKAKATIEAKRQKAADQRK